MRNGGAEDTAGGDDLVVEMSDMHCSAGSYPPGADWGMASYRLKVGSLPSDILLDLWTI